MKLLIVDSDRIMVEMLSVWLKTRGYQVSSAYNGEQAKIKWLEHQPNLVILESALQDVNALAMCQELRSQHDALVMVLTKGEAVCDEVRCLESGIDDYLRKPFYPDQLLAHMHAVTRRARSSVKMPPSSCIHVSPLVVDPLNNCVTIHDKTICLTPTEGKLLRLLAINADNVCTIDQMVTHIWGFNSAGDSALIKSHIYHLRQKIEPDPAEPRYILTIPGVGYKLVRRLDEMIEASCVRHAEIEPWHHLSSSGAC